MLHIFIDADACPVKKEVYRVADRYNLDVTIVANSWMRIPEATRIDLKVVSDSFDAADDWIVENVQPKDIVITADIPLADRCLKAGALVIGTTGDQFSEESIGDALATRELLSELRDAGLMTSGPKPLQESDRNYFLQQLDNIIQAVKRS